LRRIDPFIAVAIAIFLALGLALAFVKAPWCDEAWFVNPAYNLAFRGHLANNVLDPTGCFLNAYLRGVQQRTYIYVPNHLVGLAAWLRIVGFSAFKARAYSIGWSALGLIMLYSILRRFFADRRVAQLASLLLAIDFIFLWSSADGRPEAVTNALMLCSLFAYLSFRERDFSKAVLFSQVLAAAAAFAHPNALFLVLSMLVLVGFFDRKRLRLPHLLLAGAPYIVFACLWGIYILQSPGDFVAQFFPNVGYSDRWRGLIRPDVVIADEIHRHMAAYSLDGLWPGMMNIWMLLIPFGYLGALISLFGVRTRTAERERMFTVFAGALILTMTLLNGFKGYFYLIYLVPLYDAALAVWLLRLWRRGGHGKFAAGVLAASFAAIQLTTSFQHIRADEFHKDFEPAIRDVMKSRAAGKSIVGTSALGFGMAFSGFTDDAREGKYSGLAPDVLVIDRSYRLFASIFEEKEPKVFTHIVDTLTSHYYLASRHGSFWIFERIPEGSVPPTLSKRAIDLGKRDKAEHLFDALLAQSEQGKLASSSNPPL
jgi:dolichyl-phosphate-mannose-protein mannosyltransferase